MRTFAHKQSLVKVTMTQSGDVRPSHAHRSWRLLVGLATLAQVEDFRLYEFLCQCCAHGRLRMYVNINVNYVKPTEKKGDSF